MNNILLFRKDLQGYSTASLRKIQRNLRLPEGNRQQLLWSIATALSRRRGEMPPELPYGGNIQEAMRAGDREAIRRIMASRREQEAERSRALATEQTAEIPIQAQNCENRIDFITQDEWSADYLPSVKVEVWDFNNPLTGRRRTLCYDRETLQTWMKDFTHVMAVWVPNAQGESMSTMGLRGGPGKQLVSQLPNQLLFFGYNMFPEPTEKWVAIPAGKDVRIGNLAGIVGESMLHGQSPGYNVYTIFKAGDILELRREYEALFVRKLTERSEQGGVMLLPYLVSNHATEIMEIIAKDISEAITFEANLDLDRFKEISRNPIFSDLAKISRDNTHPYLILVRDLKMNIHHGNNVQAGAEALQKIFLKVFDDIYKEGQKNPVLERVYMYIAQEFTPDWLEDDLVQYIGELSFEDLISAFEKMWEIAPSSNADYTAQGTRRQ